MQELFEGHGYRTSSITLPSLTPVLGRLPGGCRREIAYRSNETTDFNVSGESANAASISSSP